MPEIMGMISHAAGPSGASGYGLVNTASSPRPIPSSAGRAHYAIGVSALPGPGDFPQPLALPGRTTFRVSARITVIQ
jgi:hypothetical protein